MTLEQHHTNEHDRANYGTEPNRANELHHANHANHKNQEGHERLDSHENNENHENHDGVDGLGQENPEQENHGPVTVGVLNTPPFGAMSRLSHQELVREQKATLAAPRRSYSKNAKLLFASLDVFYGRGRNLEKFRVLELIARVPYQAWEHVAYVALTHKANEPGFAGRVFTKVRSSRRQQDNEQWHLLILEELCATRPRQYGWLRTMVFPQVLAFVYYQLSWLLYAVRPDWSYRLNADFEDHAQHEYALLVEEAAWLNDIPYNGEFADSYARFASLADLFRQISVDEKIHKEESVAHLRNPRFA
jgi:ubiquinol oxidase